MIRLIIKNFSGNKKGVYLFDKADTIKKVFCIENFGIKEAELSKIKSNSFENKKIKIEFINSAYINGRKVCFSDDKSENGVVWKTIY